MLKIAVFGPSRARLAACWLSLGSALPAAAGTIHVSVVDRGGQPVERVAVYAVPSRPSPIIAANEHDAHSAVHGDHDAVMDQAHNAFVPHVLVVQTGTSVVFPNNDVVSHHVYSFSPAKTFELALYKGNAHPPLVFDQPGVVVLGCNIHDGMLGYILVVDTPHFALTDAKGELALEGLAADDYSLRVWTPRVRPGDLPAEQKVTVSAEGDVTLELKLTGKLLPDHELVLSSLSWERY
jgi:plastocyanin